MTKIGFMFGAGAELSYGLPTSGDFALNIFRQGGTESKETFKSQRDKIAPDSTYAKNWLPEGFQSKSITIFGKKAFEEIIHSTLEQNRENIINIFNHLDELAETIRLDSGCDIKAAFNEINVHLDSCSLENTIQYVNEFNEGKGLFQSKYFSALLAAYKNLRNDREHENEFKELKNIILSILQLQIGALGEKLIHRLNEGIFSKKDNDLDILDELSDFIQLNYQSVGLLGLEYLLDMTKADETTPIGQVLRFAQILLEKLYTSVLDYRSLIDSNWMYLYYPASDWGKFCKISIFLLNVQKYIHDIYTQIKTNNNGYYNDIHDAVQANRLNICAAATSNYSPLAQETLQYKNMIYLNGSTTQWYDPYLNRIGTKEDLEASHHFIVPLMFTQSGTKPMISMDMSSKYIEYFHALKKADEICVIGFNFNPDDEHINEIFRELIEKNNKSITIVTINDNGSEDAVRKKVAQNLKLQDDSHISVILVDRQRRVQGNLWLDYLLENS